MKKRFFKKSKPKDELKTAIEKVQKKEKVQVKKKTEKVVKQKTVEKAAPTKPAKPLQFPKIPRFIPEPFALFRVKGFKLRLKEGLIALFIIAAFIWNWFVLKELYVTGSNWLNVIKDREQIANQMNLWLNITQQYPNYRDAYVEGAILAYRLGDRGKEQYFLTKLQLLDPNFPLTNTLEKLGNLQEIGNK